MRQVRHIPSDAAEWPEGLPRYQGDATVELDDGTKLDLNKLEDPFRAEGEQTPER